MSDSGVGQLLPRLRCRRCAEVIGAYEPMVLTTPDGPQQTSLAAEPKLYSSEAPCFHRACYAEVGGADV